MAVSTDILLRIPTAVCSMVVGGPGSGRSRRMAPVMLVPRKAMITIQVRGRKPRRAGTRSSSSRPVVTVIGAVTLRQGQPQAGNKSEQHRAVDASPAPDCVNSESAPVIPGSCCGGPHSVWQEGRIVGSSDSLPWWTPRPHRGDEGTDLHPRLESPAPRPHRGDEGVQGVFRWDRSPQGARSSLRLFGCATALCCGEIFPHQEDRLSTTCSSFIVQKLVHLPTLRTCKMNTFSGGGRKVSEARRGEDGSADWSGLTAGPEYLWPPCSNLRCNTWCCLILSGVGRFLLVLPRRASSGSVISFGDDLLGFVVGHGLESQCV